MRARFDAEVKMILRDRPDGTSLKVPNFKKLNPYMFPTRAESMLFGDERFNIDSAIEMLLEINRGKVPEDRINLFHVILASYIRTTAERPIVNTFVAGQRYYRRNEISMSFVVKKDLTDIGEESILKIVFNPMDTLHDVARRVREAVALGKSGAGNSTEKEIDLVMALPRFGIKAFMWLYRFLDYNNLLPGVMIKTDPLYATAFFTNLGSIGMDTIYHHLYNWGTVGTFISVGKVKKGPIFNSRSGAPAVSHVIDMRFTLDDRVADGVYYGNSLLTFRHYMENPQLLLEKPAYTKEQLDELQLTNVPE